MEPMNAQSKKRLKSVSRIYCYFWDCTHGRKRDMGT
jgi:hypothetical protein